MPTAHPLLAQLAVDTRASSGICCWHNPLTPVLARVPTGGTVLEQVKSKADYKDVEPDWWDFVGIDDVVAVVDHLSTIQCFCFDSPSWPTPTDASVDSWRALANDAAWQPHCNQQGFNTAAGNSFARFGMPRERTTMRNNLMEQTHNCCSLSSFIR